MVVQPNIPGIWEDLRKLGLAFQVAAAVGGFLQEQVPLGSAITGFVVGIVAWGSGILFGGTSYD